MNDSTKHLIINLIIAAIFPPAGLIYWIWWYRHEKHHNYDVPDGAYDIQGGED